MLPHQECAAFFQENDKLLDWVNQQPLNEPITCLGDGHPGVWNLIAGIASFEKRLEILDWYHRCGKPVQTGWLQSTFANSGDSSVAWSGRWGNRCFG
jgi:hypothetical protein